MNVFKKQLLAQTGIALLVVLVGLAAIQFMAAELRSSAENIRKKNSELAVRAGITAHFDSLRSDFEKAKLLLPTLNDILPAKDQLANFGEELSVIAKRHKFDLRFIAGGETPPTENTPGFLKFSVTAETTYTNFIGFLKDAEKNKLFIKFNSVDMNRITSGDKFSILASGQVFYQ